MQVPILSLKCSDSWLKYGNIVLLCASAVVLIGLQLKPWGWVLLFTGAVTLLLCSKQFAKDLLLVYISLAVLGTTAITTDISHSHMLEMGSALILAVAIPYIVSRFIYKDYLVRFRFHHGRAWFRSEVLLIVIAAVASYIVLPFYLANTGAYLNWSVEPGTSFLTRLFIGTNFLGIWDEVFFVSTVLGILQRHLKFYIANIAQGILFTSFLYELGFTGWGYCMIFPFTLLQGYIFKKTESLFYVITIHLTVDLILFLALIHAHHPEWMPVFLIR